MGFYRDGVRHPTEIWEAAMTHNTLKVQCTIKGCEHSAVFDPHGLWHHFTIMGWDQSFYRAARRFWCTKCTRAVRQKVKQAKMTAGTDQVTDNRFPMPDPREWNRFVSRMR